MANKHMKNFSMLVIREMPIKATRDHYAQIRMVEMKRIDTVLTKMQSNWNIASRNVK